MDNTRATPSLPRTAYVLLWFPKPSETFIFREAKNLAAMGLPLSVHTLYGKLKRGLSPEMQETDIPVKRMGIPWTLALFRDCAYWLFKKPSETWKLLREVPFRRWPSLEMAGENLWAFLCGFTLARRFLAEEIQHIHSPWACGPGTAAWVASRLSGIPFSFTGRAHDIYPPDGALREKIRDAAFVRVNTRTNVDYMASFAPVGHRRKIHLVYNGISLQAKEIAPVPMAEPVRFAALGRLVPTKGYKYLLQAANILRDMGLSFRLTIAGSGGQGRKLKRLARGLELEELVEFPGHLAHHQVPKLLLGSDVFVMPSVIVKSGNRDGIPNVIMEALAHGLPVVASDVSGIGEVIVDRATGFLVPEKDSESLAQAMLTMARNRGKAIEMAARGRARVLEMFDPTANSGTMLELIKSHSLKATAP